MMILREGELYVEIKEFANNKIKNNNVKENSIERPLSHTWTPANETNI